MVSSARAAIYCRISRDRVGAGLGVERQRADCMELAERLGWAVEATYTDNDLSAYSGKPRPGYRDLLADMEAGRIGGVLAWHTDRLHRSPVELEHYIALAERMSIQTHTVRAGVVDLSTPAGRLTARQFGSIARYESEHRSERVSRKREEIASAGTFLGGARPFGFTGDGMGLEPTESAAIIEATKTVLRGGSLRSIVADWNERGLRTTKADKPWTPGAVRDVLCRARNAGLIQHRGQVVGKASWPALIGEDEWRGVVTTLTDERRRTSPGNTPRWLGSGLYLCGVCGGGLVVGTAGTKRTPSYLCRAPRKDGVRHVTRSAPHLDEYISAVLVDTLKRPDLADLLQREQPTEIDGRALRDELAVIAENRSGLATALGEGKVTLAQFTTANDAARARQEAIEAQLARLTRTDPVSVAAESDDPEQAWKDFSLEQRRAVLRRLLRVTVNHAPRGPVPGGGMVDTASLNFEWWPDSP
jgi:DNA invertase Pin-like site-specific DNA recombinase